MRLTTDVRSLQDRIHDFFESMPLSGISQAEELAWPSLDVAETPETLQITAELPGVKAEDVEINISGDRLIIRGESKSEPKDDKKTWHRRERRWGQFYRSVVLPQAVEKEAVDAVHCDGVLTVVLPKMKTAESHRIKVRES